VKFKINDIIKSDRKGTIGEETFYQVISYCKVLNNNKEVDGYRLQRVNSSQEPIELSVNFTDQGYQNPWRQGK